MSLHDNIIELIPQRSPIIMIDALLSADEKGCRGIFQIQSDNIFLEDGFLNESGLVENVAQTAAARIGWLCRQENRPVPLGYIGAVQNLVIHDLPKINEKIETEICIKNQIFDVTVISATVLCAGRAIASCEMKIFISPKP